MTAAELANRPAEAPCPDCRGLGEVLVHEHASAPTINPPEEVKDCETCDATGRVGARCNDCGAFVEDCACEPEEAGGPLAPTTTAERLARVRETGAAFTAAAEALGFSTGLLSVHGTVWPDGLGPEDEPLMSCYGRRLGHGLAQTAWLGVVRVFVSRGIPLDGLEPGPRHQSECPLHRCATGGVHADHTAVTAAEEG